MSKKHLKPVHPGEVLLEEFLVPMHLSQNRLALDIGVPPQIWLGLQIDYDLDVTGDALAKRLDREVKSYAVTT